MIGQFPDKFLRARIMIRVFIHASAIFWKCHHDGKWFKRIYAISDCSGGAEILPNPEPIARHLTVMKNSMNPGGHTRKALPAFTLVELLVVIVIVAALAALTFLGTTRLIEGGRKVKAMAQFRDFQVGIGLFEVDYQKPPIPK